MITVAKLIKVLLDLDPDDEVEGNLVGNLSIKNANSGAYKGYVDLRTGENAVERSASFLSKEKNIMWKSYTRKGAAEMRPYITGEDLSGISVNKEDTPKKGDMIARNKDNHEDQWLVAKQWFLDNYVQKWDGQHQI